MGIVKLVVDGSCLKQHGPGGWAYRFEFGGRVYKDARGVYPVTNNETELMAALNGLKAVEKVSTAHAGKLLNTMKLLILSDSQYVIRGATEWIDTWRRRNWRTRDDKPVSNRKLWEEIDSLAGKFDTRWKWVKGHAGHELNEIVDEMANDAARAIAKQRA